MKVRFAVALGLTTAALAASGISAAFAQGTAGKSGSLALGHNCMTLRLTGGRTVTGLAVPTVCVVRDTAGKRFYLFSGVFKYVAGQQPVQAQFPVSNALPLKSTAMVPVVGFVGRNPAYTYSGYGLVQPNGQISIFGPKPGLTYTVTISGQIPVGIPAGS